MHLCFTPSPGPRSIQSCSGGGVEAPLCLIPTLGPVRSVSPSFGRRRPTNLLHPAAGKTVFGGPGRTISHHHDVISALHTHIIVKSEILTQPRAQVESDWDQEHRLHLKNF